MSEHDEILLEELSVLKSQLADRDSTIRRLRGGYISRAAKPFIDLWGWWWKSDARTASTWVILILSFFASGIAWTLGGWETGNFYVADYTWDRAEIEIKQSFAWGKDRYVGGCNKDQSLTQCVSSYEAEWSDYEKSKR